MATRVKYSICEIPGDLACNPFPRRWLKCKTQDAVGVGWRRHPDFGQHMKAKASVVRFVTDQHHPLPAVRTSDLKRFTYQTARQTLALPRRVHRDGPQ